MDSGLLQERTGIEGFEAEIRSRMRLNNNIGEDLRNRLGQSNMEDIRNNLELNSIREDLRNRMGLNNIEDNIRNTIGSNSNNIQVGEDFRNSGGNGIEQRESINRMMQEYNINQGSLINHNRSSDRLTKNYEEELRRKMGFSNNVSTDVNDKNRQTVQNSSSFYKVPNSMANSGNHSQQSAFQEKNEAEDSDEKSEPNSQHLEETIEAVARNQFDYDPEAPLLRAKQNKFMDHYQIKQEPIDYDLMAANLTAGLMNPDRRHMCPHCCKGFRSRQQLLQHSLVHTNLRKYHCNYCERSFKQLSHLHQHHRIHTGEKPYTCPLSGCDKSFPQLSNLQHHIRNHDKLAESQFQCHLCDRVYPNEATLKAHNTRMHVHSKLISDLKNPVTLPLAAPVSQNPTVSTIQPRQRKRKASRPQHINNRNAVPFYSNQMDDGSGMYGNMNNFKEGQQEDYVYILDSDDDGSSDIPAKKLGISSNNNLYSNNFSQNEHFQNSQMLEKSKSDGSERSHDIGDSHQNMNGNHSNGYYSNIYHDSDTGRPNLPKMSNELPKVKSNELYPEMFRQNSNGLFSVNGMFTSPNDINQNFSNSVISNGSAFDRNQSKEESRELQKDLGQSSQLTNEMQHYSGSMGLDLSTNSSEVSRMYQSDRPYPNNQNDPIFQRIAENQSQIRNKVNAIYQDQRMVENHEHFNNMPRNSINWQRKDINQRELMNRDLELSDSDSDSESRQHFQTPNLGTDVYDDPMN